MTKIESKIRAHVCFPHLFEVKSESTVDSARPNLWAIQTISFPKTDTLGRQNQFTGRKCDDEIAAKRKKK